MKLPHRIRITSKIAYDVVFADIIKNDPECDGYTDQAARQIQIKNGLSKTRREMAFIHEVYHALCFENDITIPHETIYQLERATHAYMKINKLI